MVAASRRVRTACLALGWQRAQLYAGFIRRAGRRYRSGLWFGLAVGYSACWALFLWPVPDRLQKKASLELLSVESENLSYLREATSGSWRNWIAVEQVPRNTRDLLLLAEDARFFWHPGIDPFAILRASWQNFRQRRIVSGASTIPMQLARTLYPDLISSDPLWRKAQEARLAIRLVFWYSRARILESYINTVPMPWNRTGLQSASLAIFNRELQFLNPAEQATLVILIRSNRPTRQHFTHRLIALLEHWCAQTNHPACVARDPQHSVVAIPSSPQIAHLFQQLHRRPQNQPVHHQTPHFVFYIREKFPWLDGSVQTTLSSQLNTQLVQVIGNEFPLLEKRGAEDAAVVILELSDQTKAPAERQLVLRALIGSRDFFKPKAGQINGALIERNAGSSLKPLIYALAMDQIHLRPWSIVADTEQSFPLPGGSSYRPRNYDLQFWGQMTVREALATSRNIPAVSLAHRLGPRRIHTFFQKSGLLLKEAPDDLGPGIALGSSGARLIELARAYSMLANKGVLLPLQFGIDGESNPLYLYDGPAQRLISPSVSYQITSILSDRIARRRSFGGRNFLDFPFPVAAKTGTSKDYKDSWTIGYTPAMLVAVWVGRFEGGPMQGVSGSYGAGRIFQQAMRMAYEYQTYTLGRSLDFDPPPELSPVEICSLTGYRAHPNCPAHTEMVAPNDPILQHFCPRHAPRQLDLANHLPSNDNGNDAEMQPRDESSYTHSTMNPAGSVNEARVRSPLRFEEFLIDPHTPLAAQGVPIEISIAQPTTNMQTHQSASAPRNIWRYRIDEGQWQVLKHSIQTTFPPKRGQHVLEFQQDGKTLERIPFTIR
ncbi:MAG: transglycosylase domain-containing protein [Leptospiraceae bacterium]|nr:transglycosylase domain-containing protein [Leptospiraceae bacterium]